MTKIVAVLNVIAWSGFWAFGYLALTADGLSDRQIVLAVLLAFAGFVGGILAYMALVRSAEATGYARKPNQPDVETRNRAHAKGAN